MKLSNSLVGVSLLAAASAVDMSRYTAGPGVEPGFKTWLERIYAATEDLTAYHQFVDFFVYNTGVYGAGGTNYTGQAAIEGAKITLLPPASNQIWSHLPNSTTVLRETATDKTYEVNGTINKDLAGYKGVNNCSSQYYQSTFTINKYTPNGQVNLAPYGYSLVFYNDFGLQPSYSPNSMACESPAS